MFAAQDLFFGAPGLLRALQFTQGGGIARLDRESLLQVLDRLIILAVVHVAASGGEQFASAAILL